MSQNFIEMEGSRTSVVLRSREMPSICVIDYFEYFICCLVSQVKLIYYIGRNRQPDPSDTESFGMAQDAIIDQIGKFRLLIPSLVLLPNSERERAGMTKVVDSIIQNAITNLVSSMFTFLDMLIILSIYVCHLFRVRRV